MKTYSKYLIDYIKKEVNNANAKGVILGISGGLDSAVVAHLVKEAFPNNSLGVWMGIESNRESRRNSLRVFYDTKIESLHIDLTNTWKDMANKALNDVDRYQFPQDYSLAIANLKSRLRMTTLYAIAQSKGYLVIGTSNLAEITLGYFTKWGDAAADIYPLANLTKGEVYLLAQELGVNRFVLDAPPSADLWEGQTDEEDMGIKYIDIDKYIKGEKISPAILKKIETKIKINNHKQLGIRKPDPWNK